MKSEFNIKIQTISSPDELDIIYACSLVKDLLKGNATKIEGHYGDMTYKLEAKEEQEQDR